MAAELYIDGGLSHWADNERTFCFEGAANGSPVTFLVDYASLRVFATGLADQLDDMDADDVWNEFGEELEQVAHLQWEMNGYEGDTFTLQFGVPDS
ncbi:hypothetical protein [Sphingorhabdus sp.]|uniref:hypothetical protein n=1 Tax=Sphingorhabdus sp. TaxID=1902408 RepID=UPI003593B40F